jgi:ATP-dependent Clp protease adapter protein ClpS
MVPSRAPCPPPPHPPSSGNHEGHEYYFHRTGAGGCCDCGDPEAWAPGGFCKFHTGPLENDDPLARLPPVTRDRSQLVIAAAVEYITACMFATRGAVRPLTAGAVAEPGQGYTVVLHNDDVHTFEDVIHVLLTVVGATNAAAGALTKQVGWGSRGVEGSGRTVSGYHGWARLTDVARGRSTPRGRP